MNTLLSLENISYKVKSRRVFDFDNKEKSILQNISFSLEVGHKLGIAGESGSGKTTLAKIIAGAIIPTEGKIIFSPHNKKNKMRTSPIQILFQNNGEILNPYRKINNILEEAISIRNNFKNHTDMEKIIEEKERILKAVNFSKELLNRKGYELSGGEQQRAALARLLAAKPELLILDEPFSAQDPESQLNLLNLFNKINSDMKITIICIAHNLQILNKLCDKILIIYKGEIVEQGSTSNIFSSPQHSYTKFLLNAGKYNLSSEEIRYIEE